MGTYTLAPPAVEEVEEPKVGDANVPKIALGALLMGAFFLVSGAYMYRRSRNSRSLIR